MLKILLPLLVLFSASVLALPELKKGDVDYSVLDSAKSPTMSVAADRNPAMLERSYIATGESTQLLESNQNKVTGNSTAYIGGSLPYEVGWRSI